MKDQKLPYKRYNIGPVFRDEPISGNRFRQFTQCDIDTIKSSIKDEAEILSITNNILNELELSFTIFINNRKLLNEILTKNNINEKDFEGVIREIDKLDKIPEADIINNLKKYKAESILKILNNDYKQYDSYSEILELQKYCKLYNVKVKFLPTLARGLSYYNGSVFEVKTKKMKETITAGGSYIFNNIQSTGISFGLDRLSSLVKINSKEKFLVLSISQDEKAIEIAEKLRENNIVYLSSAKISKALDFANSKNVTKVVFVGENEVKQKKVKIKDMKTGKEKLVSLKELI